MMVLEGRKLLSSMDILSLEYLNVSNISNVFIYVGNLCQSAGVLVFTLSMVSWFLGCLALVDTCYLSCYCPCCWFHVFSILRIYTFSLLLTLDPATKQASTMKVNATSHEYQWEIHLETVDNVCYLGLPIGTVQCAKQIIFPRLSQMFYSLLIHLSFDRLRLSSHVWLDQHIDTSPIESWRVLDTERKKPSNSDGIGGRYPRFGCKHGCMFHIVLG